MSCMMLIRFAELISGMDFVRIPIQICQTFFILGNCTFLYKIKIHIIVIIFNKRPYNFYSIYRFSFLFFQ